MQTKRKRKQWVLLAFTMIATFVLQIVTPLTANAEEQTYNNFLASTSTKQIRDDDSTHWEYCYDYSISSNTPYKICVLRHDDGKYLPPFFYEMVSVYIIFDESVFTNDTCLQINKMCDDKCAEKHNCNHVSSVTNYTSNDFKTYYDKNGKKIAYGHELSLRHYDYNPLHDDSSIYKYYSTYLELNDSIVSYVSTEDLTDNNTYVITSEDSELFIQGVYDGSIRPNGQFDESTAIYDTNIPTPNITVKNDYSFGFNNDSDGYYFQVKGRWYSVDDIELFKQNFQWKYKYYSYVKSNLTDWVTTNEKASTSMQDLNFATFGKTAFDSFLSYYPLDNRSYSGSTEIRGYNDAINTIKMLLKVPESIYNGLEVYIRYYTFDENGVAHYGKWCHYYDNLANASGSSGSQWDDKENMFTGNQSQDGLTDSQFGELENTDNSRNDIDVTPEYNDDGFDSIILGDMDTTSLVTALESMYGQTKTFISMIGLVFNFLPPWIITLSE